TMPAPSQTHGKIQVQTGAILWHFVRSRSLGLVVANGSFRLSSDTVRVPDIAFIRADRAPNSNLEPPVEGAPDLAIDIISPSETAAQIARKVRQYLHAGAQAVWVMYPWDRTVHVFESSNRAWILEAGDLLEAPGLLPDFSVRVGELFY